MPTAVEAQRVEIINHSGRPRRLTIVMTGVFGITGPVTIANDVVFANIVVESELFYRDGHPAALTLHHQPRESAGEKRFAALLCRGETMDAFCTSQSDFVGSGTLEHPELVAHLPSRYSRKTAPFFALSKTFNLAQDAGETVDEFVGMAGDGGGRDGPLRRGAAQPDGKVCRSCRPGRDAGASDRLLGSLSRLSDAGDRDKRFTAYVSHNLPFQVLYQTYVSRAFAWTQKSYRETGFREIQDIYASMYYLSAMGKNGLIKDLISNWVRSVFRMGYAYHDFTFQGRSRATARMTSSGWSRRSTATSR